MMLRPNMTRLIEGQVSSRPAISLERRVLVRPAALEAGRVLV
jgi:hypothetical protein